MTVLLRGNACPQLQQVIAAALGPRCALALTRGHHPKRYAHLDPNEDVVGGALTADGCVLLAADGHNGADAAEHSADSALSALGEDPSARADLLGVLAQASRAAWTATRAHPYPRRGSRTALALAVLSGSTVRWVSIGDVSVLAGSPRDLRQLNERRHVFLGGPLDVGHVKALADQGSFELGPGEWLVLATDGLLDFARIDAVGAVLSAAAAPGPAAEAMLQLAGAGGAGDNVGVAVLGPA